MNYLSFLNFQLKLFHHFVLIQKIILKNICIYFKLGTILELNLLKFDDFGKVIL